ncbi:MAG: site-2 protease family protein [Bacteriovoracia bacterium]
MGDFDLNLLMQRLAINIVPFIMAVVLHEFAHGFVASKWGDNTARDSGRLTMNPAPHMDLMGTVILPLMMFATNSPILFGWAKPVPINPNRFKKYRSGLFWVSFAGPLMNITLALLAAAFLCALLRFSSNEFYLYEPLFQMAQVAVGLNFSLAIFNLLPIPPLDGSKMIQSFLSYTATQKYEAMAQYSFWIILALIMTGAIQIIGIPIHFLATQSVNLMAHLFGLM